MFVIVFGQHIHNIQVCILPYISSHIFHIADLANVFSMLYYLVEMAGWRIYMR